MFYTYIYIYTSNKFKSLTSATGVSRKLPNGLILRETQSSGQLSKLNFSLVNTSMPLNLFNAN